jgi:hypothetical protein
MDHPKNHHPENYRYTYQGVKNSSDDSGVELHMKVFYGPEGARSAYRVPPRSPEMTWGQFKK